MSGIVSGDENIEGDRVASINVVGILFTVLEGKDRVVINFWRMIWMLPKDL